MTTIFISKFKEFMDDLGMWEDFVSAYESSEGIPEKKSVEDYLASVNPPDVLSAAPFQGVGEWQTVSELWVIEAEKVHRALQKNPETDDKAVAFSSTSSGYKFCPRCFQLKKLSQFNKESSRVDGYSPYCRDCSGSSASRQPVKEMSIHEGVYCQNRIFLSKELSTLIKDKDARHCKVTVRKGQCFLVFAKNGSSNLKHYKTAESCSVSDIDVSKALAKFFHKTIEDAFYLHLSKNTSKKDDVITIEVMKVYSPEDYKSIRFIRKEEHPMAQKKDDRPASAKVSVPVPDKSWEDMSSSEKINYINSLLVDPHDVVPAKFDLLSLLCDYVVDHPCHDGMSFGENVMATSLAKMGWKLQQPVRVIKYEEFKI